GVEDVPDPQLFEAPGFTGRFAAPDELCRLTGDPTYDLPADFVTQALERGDRCYGLWQGDLLAAYGWYSNQPTAIDDQFILHFDPAYTYMYKGFTLPAFRGQRL